MPLTPSSSPPPPPSKLAHSPPLAYSQPDLTIGPAAPPQWPDEPLLIDITDEHGLTSSDVQISACKGDPLNVGACISEMDDRGLLQVLGLATISCIVLCLGMKGAVRTVMRSLRLDDAVRKEVLEPTAPHSSASKEPVLALHIPGPAHRLRTPSFSRDCTSKCRLSVTAYVDN